MKQLLLVTDSFYPYSNANTNCIAHLLPALQADGFAVTVLTVAYEKGLPAVDEWHGCKIYRAAMPEVDTVDRVLYRNPVLAKRPLRLLRGVLGKTAFACTGLLKRIRLQRALRQAEGTFPYVLSVVNPIDAHRIAYAVAGRDAKWVMYNLDAFVFNSTYSPLFKRSRMRQEKRWCRRAAGVVNTIGLREENEKNGYDPYQKIRQLDLPLPNFVLPDTAYTYRRDTTGKVTLRYMGMFYEDIRRPDELLRFLDTLDAEQYTAEFYGSCCDYLRAHFPSLPACVQLMGTVSTEECRQLALTADILMNVGNHCANQVPSKVFECIAAGRPILNFYTLDNEIGLAYLRRYPCACSVRSAQEITQRDLDALLEKADGMTLRQLRDIYADCLNENVAAKFVNFIESV